MLNYTDHQLENIIELSQENKDLLILDIFKLKHKYIPESDKLSNLMANMTRHTYQYIQDRFGITEEDILGHTKSMKDMLKFEQHYDPITYQAWLGSKGYMQQYYTGLYTAVTTIIHGMEHDKANFENYEKSFVCLIENRFPETGRNMYLNIYKGLKKSYNKR